MAWLIASRRSRVARVGSGLDRRNAASDFTSFQLPSNCMSRSKIDSTFKTLIWCLGCQRGGRESNR